jgi:hypothetical protein
MVMLRCGIPKWIASHNGHEHFRVTGVLGKRAEYQRSAGGMIERTGTLIRSSELHHITGLPGNGGVYRDACSAVPLPAVSSHRANITLTPEPWQRVPDGISHPQAAEALAFHAGRLTRGEQGIGHESVSVEHGVIESRHVTSLGRGSK